MRSKTASKTKSRVNPNGANQYKQDPRQGDFLLKYLDPKSPTYSNAYQSAKSAGYAEEYSQSILNLGNEWISEAMGRRKKMLYRAEERLNDALNCDDIKIASENARFIAKTLGKNEGYSERTESISVGITTNIKLNQDEQIAIDNAIKGLLMGNKGTE